MKDRNTQIKSKQRVAAFGEVFTANREVESMLDLLGPSVFDIYATILEPACGTGVFLISALERKISTVKMRYHSNSTAYNRLIVLAVSSVYGVDIQQDNVQECRSKLLKTALSACKLHSSDMNHALTFILQHNIIVGDTLQMSDLSGHPLIFPEWTMLSDGTLIRKDYSLAEILHHNGEYNDLARKQYRYLWLKEASHGARERSSACIALEA